MKKVVLLMVGIVVSTVFLMAQKTWNFSDTEVFNGNVMAAIPNGTTVDGLTNHSANSKHAIDNSNKSFTLDNEDYAFTRRFKFGENGSFEEGSPTTPKTGVLTFEIAAGSFDISVIGAHASNSGTPRQLVVAAKKEDALEELGYFEVEANAMGGSKFSYSGEATTIYIYSRNGGVNLYLVKYAAGSSVIPGVTAAKEIRSVEYFDLLGRKLNINRLPHTVLIRKTIYTDGSSSGEKIVNLY